MLLGSGVAAGAQTVIDFRTEPRIKFGPVGFTPSVVLTEFGVDNNVFNEATNPTADFTATLVPTLQTEIRAGRFALRLDSSAQLVYFRELASQRTVNSRQEVIAAVQLNRITGFVSGLLSSARERPSIEIDTRIHRRQTSVGAGLQAQIGPRLTFQIEGRRPQVRFAEDAIYRGTSLPEQLDQTATSLVGSLGYALTPLTRIIGSVDRQDDRFEFSPLRNARSMRLLATLEFGRTALISGRAAVGVRRFDASDARVQDFTGLVASTDLSYTFRGRTQFGVRIDRDLAYSFTPTAPYYLLTSVGGVATHRLRANVDVTASANRQHLGYRRLATLRSGDSQTNPADSFFADPLSGTGSTYLYGAGVSVAIRGASRIGFNVTYSARPAGVLGQYENLRYFTTISHAF
jgi:hypothetical protein